MNTAEALHHGNSQPLYRPSPGTAIPSGRLIKSSTRKIIPLSQPTNIDIPKRSATKIIRPARFSQPSSKAPQHVPMGKMVISGFLVGAISSAIVVQSQRTTTLPSSGAMLGFISGELRSQTRPLTNTSRRVASVLPNLAPTLERQVRPAYHPTSTEPQIQTARDGGGDETKRSFRLASFSTTLHTSTPDAAPSRAVRATLSLATPARQQNIQVPQGPLPRNTLARVLSIISKYAPKSQNPVSLAQAIVKESAAQGYDPLFVAAVIKSESTFNSRARSNKGAQGLMQIMPATGAWLSAKNDIPKGKLTDPGHNLKLGISYLKHLESEYNGDRMFTLVAYNWGPGHVESASGGKRRIPKECMTYALKILGDYHRWRAGVI